MGKTGNPWIYKMVLYPVCHGEGIKPNNSPCGFDVCRECSGFGLLLKGTQDEIQGVEKGDKISK